jgi:hypothetical protein
MPQIQVRVNAFDLPGLDDDPVFLDSLDDTTNVKDFKETVQDHCDLIPSAHLHFFIGNTSSSQTKDSASGGREPRGRELNDFRQLGYYADVRCFVFAMKCHFEEIN